MRKIIEQETQNTQNVNIDGENITSTDDESNKLLDYTLKLMDFTNHPLPKRQSGNFRIFYNNIHGIKINELVQIAVKAKIEKKIRLLKEGISYIKLESLLHQMRQWEVNLMALSEPCIDWREMIPRRVVQTVSKKLNSIGCYTVASSTTRLGSFVKPGGALLYSDNGWAGILQQKNTEFGRKIAITEILQSAVRMLKKKLYLEFTEILQ